MIILINFLFVLVNKKKVKMVQCNLVDGKPCICQLDDPRIIYRIQVVIKSMIKLCLGTQTARERNELRTVMQMSDTKTYLKLYLENLSVHHDMIHERIFNELYREF